MGLFYPVLARVQHVMSGNYNGARGSQASDEHQPRGLGAQQQSVPESASQQNIESQGRDGKCYTTTWNIIIRRSSLLLFKKLRSFYTNEDHRPITHSYAHRQT